MVRVHPGVLEENTNYLSLNPRHKSGVFCFIPYHTYSLHIQIMDTIVMDTPLQAYEIKSTYVQRYPAQNESKQNPLTQRKVQPTTWKRRGWGAMYNRDTHCTAIFWNTNKKPHECGVKCCERGRIITVINLDILKSITHALIN